MSNRPAIPDEITREILIECGHRCAVCGTPCPLERAHIIPWHKSKEHKAEDLICLCANCHQRADHGKWGEKTLREYKEKPWVIRKFESADAMPKPTIRLEFEINMELEAFNETYQRWLQFAIAAFLGISPHHIRIVSKERGSVRVTIELPTQSAEKLLSAYEDKNPELLNYLDPMDVRDLRPRTQSLEQIPPSEQEAREAEGPRRNGQYPVEMEQKRFNKFIRAENERLNRLIRNLYLHFQLEHYSERELYDRICQEVAEYFRAASCELYVIRYEEEDSLKGITSRTWNGRNGRRRLVKWLELVGAFGPGRRALRQQYVTQRSRSRYEIPIEQVGPAEISGMTRQAFVRENPTRYASGYDWRTIRGDSSGKETSNTVALKKDSPRQVIWYQDGLYNSCRCSLMAPLVREGKRRGSDGNTPYYRRIGLIKLENRAPYGVAGFSDVPSESVNHNHLFFSEEWKIAALRPYVRDLQGAVKKKRDPFLPLHNNIGWQQYFEDHLLGAHYFRQLLQGLRQRREGSNRKAIEQQLPDIYKELSGWLEDLVECLIQLESWLQHLRYACRLMSGAGARPSLETPTPSLFNVYNLRSAYLEQMREDSTTDWFSNEDGKQNRYVYDTLYDALLDCLTKQNRGAKEKLRTLEAILSNVEKTELLVRSIPYHHDVKDLELLSESQKTVKDLVEHYMGLQRQEQDEEQLNVKYKAIDSLYHEVEVRDVSDLQSESGELQEALQNSLAAVSSIQQFAAQEVEDLTRNLAEQRAMRIRAELGIPVNDDFGAGRVLIEQALDGELPDLDFQRALKAEVLGDLESICNALEDPTLEERILEYELMCEEDEVCRVSKVVLSILDGNRNLEKWYGVNCKLLEFSNRTHNEPAYTTCETARALAAATMYADSFRKIDETRLDYIASHIVKVLDNHMLHQARQRGLELDFGTVDVLGLEHFGLELLDILHSHSQRIASALLYLLESEAYRSGNDFPQLYSDLLPLKELVKGIGEYIEGGEGSKQEEWGEWRVATITSPSAEAGKCILNQIYHRATLLGLEMEPAQKSAQPPCRIAFRPAGSLLPGGEERLTESVLHLNGIAEGQQYETHCMELLIRFKRSALYDRDLRALWSAVSVLENTLKVIEVTTGGALCYN